MTEDFFFITKNPLSFAVSPFIKGNRNKKIGFYLFTNSTMKKTLENLARAFA
jgi:hypothetical protein